MASRASGGERVMGYNVKSDDPEYGGFVLEFEGMQKEVYKIAKEKGWWENPREEGTLIALMHSELSEALEALRRFLQ